MAGKLARDIVMWWCMSPPTGRMLHRHVRALGIPAARHAHVYAVQQLRRVPH
jgi:hypothetical protein